MPIFSYRVKDKKGRRANGIMEAASEDNVAELLEKKGFFVLDVSKKKIQEIQETHFAEWLFNRVSSKDLVIFFHQLSLMIRANLPIIRIFRILVRQTENKKLKLAISAVADEVDGGASLSASMSQFKDIFGSFAINVISSGETSGRLAEVVDYLADQQEKDYGLGSKIKGAMIYPAFIVGALFVVGFLVMTFVIPQTTAMLKDTGATLPLVTQILITVSDIFKNFWWAIILVGGGLVVFVLYFVTQVKMGKEWLDRFQLHVPIFGPLFQKIYVVRIIRSLETLLKGGVPAAAAMESVRDLVGNSVYAKILDEAVRLVNEGNPISEGFNDNKEVPLMVSQMMSVGEETGKLDEVLSKLGDFYTKEIDNAVGNLTTMIEPLIMVILGVAVGGFVAAVILPTWQMAGAM